MKALILIDIQNDFLPGGSLEVPEGDLIIPVVNQIQTHFDLVVATQDWHPQEHKSFASNHTGKQQFELIDLKGLPQVLWPDHCIQGSTGAEFSNKVSWNSTEAIFRKGTDTEIDSYSGFYDNGHLKSTGLADFLKGKNIKEVFVAGLAADYCVYFTALDSTFEGFTTYLIEDATKAIDADGFQKAKQELTAKGARIIDSSYFSQL